MSNRIYKLFAVGALPLVLHGCGGCGDDAEPAVNSTNATNSTTSKPVEANTTDVVASSIANIESADLDSLIKDHFKGAEQDTWDQIDEFTKEELFQFIGTKKQPLAPKSDLFPGQSLTKSGSIDVSYLVAFTINAFDGINSYPAPPVFDSEKDTPLFDEDDFDGFFSKQKKTIMKPNFADIQDLRADIMDRNVVYVTESSQVKGVTSEAVVVIYDGEGLIGDEEEDEEKTIKSQSQQKQKQTKKQENTQEGKVSSLMMLGNDFRPELLGSLGGWVGVVALQKMSLLAAFKETHLFFKTVLTMKFDFENEDTKSKQDIETAREDYEKYISTLRTEKEKQAETPFSRWRMYDPEDGIERLVGATAPSRVDHSQDLSDAQQSSLYNEFKQAAKTLMKVYNRLRPQPTEGIRQHGLMWDKYCQTKFNSPDNYEVISDQIEDAQKRVDRLQASADSLQYDDKLHKLAITISNLKAQLAPPASPALPALPGRSFVEMESSELQEERALQKELADRQAEYNCILASQQALQQKLADAADDLAEKSSMKARFDGFDAVDTSGKLSGDLQRELIFYGCDQGFDIPAKNYVEKAEDALKAFINYNGLQHPKATAKYKNGNGQNFLTRIHVMSIELQKMIINGLPETVQEFNTKCDDVDKYEENSIAVKLFSKRENSRGYDAVYFNQCIKNAEYSAAQILGATVAFRDLVHDTKSVFPFEYRLAAKPKADVRSDQNGRNGKNSKKATYNPKRYTTKFQEGGMKANDKRLPKVVFASSDCESGFEKGLDLLKTKMNKKKQLQLRGGF